MKTREELLKFYGVEEGYLYIITKAKKQEDKPLVGSHFTIKPRRFEPDELGVAFEKGVSYNISILNDLEYSKASVLDENEKRYLKNVIKPFKNRVSAIIKYKSQTLNMEWIQICITDVNIGTTTTKESFSLPNFKSGTMYKGMIPNKRYTLTELGLL